MSEEGRRHQNLYLGCLELASRLKSKDLLGIGLASTSFKLLEWKESSSDSFGPQDFWLMYQVLEGELALEHEGKSRIFKSNQLMLIPPETEIVKKGFKGGRALSVIFRSRKVGDKKNLLHIFSREVMRQGMIFKINKDMRGCIHKLIEALSERPLFYLSKCEGVFTEYLATLMEIHFKERLAPEVNKVIRHNLTDAEIANQVEEWVKSNPLSRLSIENVAEQFGFSSRHLNRIVQAQRGITVGALIQKAKIEECCRLLRDSDDSLQNIANKAGYQHASYMVNAFKSKMRMTPGAYRKTVQ